MTKFLSILFVFLTSNLFSNEEFNIQFKNETYKSCFSIAEISNNEKFIFNESELNRFSELRHTLDNSIHQNYISVESNNALNCINDLLPGTEYEIIFKKGLTFSLPICQNIENLSTGDIEEVCDENNRVPKILEDNLVRQFKTLDIKPEILVDNSKYVLPLDNEALLPFSSVNVSKLDFELRYLQERQIHNISDLFQRTYYSYVSNLRGQTKLINSGSIQIPFEKNVYSKNNLDLGFLDNANELSPGIYLLLIKFNEEGEIKEWDKYPENVVRQWFVKTNIGISMYKGMDNSIIEIQNLRTANSIPDTNIQIISKGNSVIFEGISDNQGIINVPNSILYGLGDNSAEMITAYTEEGDFSFIKFSNINPNLSVKIGGNVKNSKIDIFTSLERELYRVGDKLTAAILARDYNLNLLSEEYPIKIEIVNPKNDVIFSDFISFGEKLINKVEFQIPNSSINGEYYLNTYTIDGFNLSSNKFYIEDFVPLTLESAILISDDQLTVYEENNINIKGNYFSGAKAVGLSGELQLKLKSKNIHSNKNLQNYYFGNSKNTVNRFDIFNFDLDDNGEYLYKLDFKSLFEITDLNKDFKGNLFDLEITSSLFDIGGRPNKTTSTFPLETNNQFIGIKKLFNNYVPFGETAEFEVILINRQGEFLEDQSLMYQINTINYNDSWNFSESLGWNFNRSKTIGNLIEKGQFNNKLSINNLPKKASYQLKIFNNEGISTITEFEYGFESGTFNASTPYILNPKYVINSENFLELAFDSSYSGIGKVFLADNNIFEVIEINVNKGLNKVSFPIDPTREPGFNVLLSIKRPVEKGSEHLPQISIGSLWVENLSNDRIFNFSQQHTENTNSTDDFKVSIDAEISNGQAIIFVVDEGIHKISNYKYQNPSDHYFGDRELGLYMISNFGQIIKQNENLLTFKVGGDSPSILELILKSDFFNTFSETSPVIDIVDGKAQHNFGPLNFEGEVRVVSIVTDDKYVTQKVSSAIVEDPLSTDISLPRFIAIGDKVNSAVQLRANEDVDDAKFEYSINKNLNLLEFSLNKGDTKKEYISITSDNLNGVDISMSTVFDNQIINNKFNLVSRYTSYPITEIKTYPIPESKILSSKTVKKINFNNIDLKNNSDYILDLSLSNYPGFGIEQILNDLDVYPYGCIEQLSSSVLALVYRYNIQGDPDGSIKKRINEALLKIFSYQKSDSSFGYWSNTSYTDDSFQIYLLGTLYSIPEDLLSDEMLDQIDLKMSNLINNYLFSQMYWDDLKFTSLDYIYFYWLLETLTSVDFSDDIRYLLDSLENPNFLEAASAYTLASIIEDDERIDKYKSLSDELSDNFVSKKSKSILNFNSKKWEDPSKINEYELTKEYLNTSEFHALRMISEINEFTNQQITQSIQNALNAVREKIITKDYRSTLENAFVGGLLLFDLSEEIEIEIDGNKQIVNLGQNIDISNIDLMKQFKFSHNSEKNLFLNAKIVGKRNEDKAIDSGIKLSKQLFNMNNTYLDPFKGALSLNQGDLIQVVLRIEFTDQFKNSFFLLTDYLPSGFEIETTNAEDMPIVDYKNNFSDEIITPDYEEILDDRYIASIINASSDSDFEVRNFDSSKTYYIPYIMRSSYSGEMALPDAHMESMYNPTFFGRSEIGSVIVNKKE